jgi:hypothetical protein
MKPETEKTLRKILREELARANRMRPKGSAPVEQELAPLPPRSTKQGRKHLSGTRIKIATNLDSVLYRLLGEKSRATGQQMNHLLDSALWNFLGKPKMSFEVDE